MHFTEMVIASRWALDYVIESGKGGVPFPNLPHAQKKSSRNL